MIKTPNNPTMNSFSFSNERSHAFTVLRVHSSVYSIPIECITSFATSFRFGKQGSRPAPPPDKWGPPSAGADRRQLPHESAASALHPFRRGLTPRVIRPLAEDPWPPWALWSHHQHLIKHTHMLMDEGEF